MRKMKLVTTIITIAMFFFSIFSSTIQYSNAVTFEKFGSECYNYGFNSGHNTLISGSSIKAPFIKKWLFNGNSELLFSSRNLVANQDSVFLINGEIGATNLISIDKKNGKIKNSARINPFLLPSLAMTKDLVFFGDMGELIAFESTTLKKKWSSRYVIDDDNFLFIFYRASPTTYKDKVVFHDYENLVCLNSNGSVAWKTKCENGLFDLPTISDDKVFYANDKEKSIYCFDFNNGKKIWESESLNTNISLITAHDNKLYVRGIVSMGEELEDSKSNILCLNMSDGQKQWEYNIDDLISIGNPISNGKYIFNTLKKNTKCLDINNGKEIWSIETKDMMLDYPLMVNESAVIISSENKSLYMLDINNGKIISESEIDFLNTTSPAYDSKYLYFVNEKGELICLEQDTDIEPWNIKITPASERIKVDGQMQFNATVLNKNNNQVAGEVAWSVNPPDAGTISKTGLFKGTKPGKHKVIAKIKNITGEAEIVVENIPPEFSTKSLDFGEIDFGVETPKMNVEIKNNSKFPYEIKVTPSYSWIGVEKENLTVEPGSTGTLAVFPVLEKMEPGKAYKGKILLDCGDNTADIDFYVRIKKLAPLSIDSETTIKLHDLKINSMVKKVLNLKNDNFVEFNCKIITEDSWLTFNSTEFKVAPKSEYNLEMSASTAGMKNDEAKTGKFTMESNTGKIEFMIFIKTTNDLEPPAVEITELVDVTDATEFEITGKTEKEAKVLISQADSKYEVTMDEEKFKCKVALLPAPSMNKFKLVATDLAGNVTEKEITIINSHLIDVTMTVGNPIMYINGKATPINPPPTIIKGATMVPLRTVAEVFGCEVTYTSGLIQIKSKRGDNIILNLNSTGAIVNNNPKTCNPPPTLYKGKTMVPFRFIAEALGAQVSWEQSSKKIGMKLVLKP